MLNLKIPGKTITITVAILIILGSVGIKIFAEEQSVLMEIEPSTNTIITGGPCIINCTITNPTTSTITVNPATSNLAFERSSDFYFEMLDENGKQVAKNFSIPWLGGIGIVQEIFPNRSLRLKLILNQWCSTSLPAGKYKIMCYFHPILEYENQRRKMRDKEEIKEFVPITGTVKSECQIEILSINKKTEQQLHKTFYELLDNVLNDKDNDSINQIIEAKKLIFSDSPLVVPYLTKLILAEKIYGFFGVENDIKEYAIEGFKRVGNIEAAKELVNFVKGEKHIELSDSLKTKMILETFHLQDISKDTEVIKVCKEITTITPRPKEKSKPID